MKRKSVESDRSGHLKGVVGYSSLPVSGPWCLPDFVDLFDSVGDRVPQNIEPAAATGRMAPLLGVPAFGVLAIEKIISPLLI
jgi:hypothetical protein|tara:strand:+ start:75 stop:320 length:246 start_codon:yes stop_codon:yes gene_type:complete